MKLFSTAAGRARRAWLSKWLAGPRSTAAPAGSAPLFRPLALDPFVGEIMLIASNFAPRGWAFCDGSTLSINQSTLALFSLLGITYGGNGVTTFSLPDLRGRVPLGAGAGPGLTPRSLGSRGGVEGVALTVDQLPTHPNQPAASADLGTTAAPAAAYPANGGAALYAAAATPQATQPSGALGGGQAHNNLQPYLALNYVIGLYGIYPRRP